MKTAIVLAAAALLVVPLVVARRSAPNGKAAPVAASSGALSDQILSVDHAAFSGDRWYIADGRSDRIHTLDSTGVRLSSFGRRGSGPGELRAPQLVAATTRHVYVADLQRAEVSVFTTAGEFVKYLKPARGCAQSGFAQMVARGDQLFVLRRCWEGRSAIRYQVERSMNNADLEVWPVATDTVRLADGRPVPFHVPLLDVSARQLVVGDGVPGCVRVFELAGARARGRRCFTEFERQPISAAERAQLARRWRGRIGIPDSLPRLRSVTWRDSVVIVQSIETSASGSWLALSGQDKPRLLRAQVAAAFMGGSTLLIAHEEAEGVRIEVARVH